MVTFYMTQPNRGKLHFKCPNAGELEDKEKELKRLLQDPDGRKNVVSLVIVEEL